MKESVLILFWIAIVSTSADPNVCYYCNSQADGTACHSPMNISGVRIQFCGNSTVTSSSDIGEITSEEVSESATGAYVCTTMTYVSNANVFVTIRECQASQLQGSDICSYISGQSITASYGRNFSCQSCSTDLCNTSSASVAHLSIMALLGVILVKLLR